MRNEPIASAPMALSDRARSTEGGFTLVEISVVVLILGVLLGLAIPSFLGARSRAADADVAASLRTALTTGIATSDARSNFLLATPLELAAYEPSLTYVDGSTPSTGPKVVSVDATASDRWVAVVRSDSGTCFAVVAGPFGQARTDGIACAAADIDMTPPSPIRRSITHQGPITAVTPGMCLEVVTGSFLEQHPCTGSQAPMVVETRSDGYSTLSLGGGSCFGTVSPTRSARVIEEVCDDADDQLWTVIPSFNGTVQFKNKETGYCLDVFGASNQAGADLIQWGYGDPPDATCKPTTSANNHNFSLG